jgi:hypothetical protein
LHHRRQHDALDRAANDPSNRIYAASGERQAARRSEDKMATVEDIRGIALELPGAYEQLSFGGRPSWRTKPRMFTWIRDDPEGLVVWVDSEDEKRSLIAAEPDKFFTTPHYDGNPIVLAHLEVLDRTEATELVTESWRLRAPRTLVKQWDAAQGH